MKRWIAAALLCAAIIGLVALCGGQPREAAQTDYLRIHVRANSNAEEDQAVKYAVRDAVLSALTPAVAACESKEEAMVCVEKALPALESVAQETLAAHGFFYGARASLRREEFPTRVYEGATLPAGVYDALILELGTGEGDNWWCVVYPPLCFGGGEGDIVYKSRIKELIDRFFG